METKKINFNQKKYILPLIILPFIMFLGYMSKSFFREDEKEIIDTELSTYLGDSKDSILTKNAAYDKFFKKMDNRTLLDGLEHEKDSINYYTDNLTDTEKRFVDSLKEVRKEQARNNFTSSFTDSYYNENISNNEYQSSLDDELLKILNESNKQSSNNSPKVTPQKSDKRNPLNEMRKQMSLIDSISKAKDPNYQAQKLAKEKKKKQEEKKQKFISSTFNVTKTKNSSAFNSVHKEEKDNLVKAVIDENIKGYLGSRIRFRLLEDIYVGKHKVLKGTFLYGEITGFSMQRVALNVVSVLNKGKILPINLTVYDMDGLKGLYIPNSNFREMMKEFGANTAQGANIDAENQMFFISMASQLFNSASKTMANLIRKNKVKLKYNSYIYLINEKDLEKNENND